MPDIKIFLKLTNGDKEYAGVIDIPKEKMSEKYIRDQGYQFIDAAIRTLRNNGVPISE
jgi:hypothetical protein